MISEFYARRPITAWIFTIGALLVLAWAFFGRAFAGSAPPDQVITATPGPSPDAMLAASTQVQLANVAAAADATRQENELQLGLANIALQNTLGQAQLVNEDRASERGYQAEIFNIRTGERLGVAQLEAQSQALSITAALEQNADNNATTVELARNNASLETQLALINSNVQMNAANNATAAAASRRNSRSGIAGVIGGILGGIFSDVRLKSNVVRCGTMLGLPLYEYSYTAEAHNLDPRLPHGRVRGFLAQDLLNSRYAHAVGQRGGFLTVDYGAIR